MECELTEAVFSNSYPRSGWTTKLVKAAHNYQISQKEPGAWAHNMHYIAQLLIDSIEDLEQFSHFRHFGFGRGNDELVLGLVRPDLHLS